MTYKSQLPSVNKLGKILEREGFKILEMNALERKKAYIQTDGNCIEIASRVAEMFGYTPTPKHELINKLYAIRANWVLCNPLPNYIASPSPANFIVRCPDNLDDAHITLEAYGREYNYGDGTKQGFRVKIRIPLRRQQSGNSS